MSISICIGKKIIIVRLSYEYHINTSTKLKKPKNNEKIKPLKQARNELRNKLKLEIEEAKHEEIKATANSIINKIKHIHNQDNELENICKMMKMI